MTLGVRPDPVHVQAVDETARLLADLGHDVREIDPRYPDPTAAFVPQFFAGIRTEADLVEHYERLERRTRETYRLGSWVTPRVLDWALRRRAGLGQGQPVFDAVDVLLTPSPRTVRRRSGCSTASAPWRASLLVDAPIAYVALWNVAGNPAARCLRPGRRRAAGRGPAGRPHRRRGQLFSALGPARAGPPVAPGRRPRVMLLQTPAARLRRLLRPGAPSPLAGAPSWSPAPPRASARPPPARRPRGARPCCSSPAAPTSSTGSAPRSWPPAAGDVVPLRPHRPRRRRRAGRAAARPSTVRSTTWSTTPAARSGAPSHLSYDRFHDVERTWPSTSSAVRLTLGLLPAMRAQRFGHVVNIVTWGVQLKAPKFSAYIASKTALDIWSRIAAREAYGDNVTFTNMRFALVRTAMAAPTEAYAGAGMSPEQAARRVVRALEERPVHVNTFAGQGRRAAQPGRAAAHRVAVPQVRPAVARLAGRPG